MDFPCSHEQTEVTSSATEIRCLKCHAVLVKGQSLQFTEIATAQRRMLRVPASILEDSTPSNGYVVGFLFSHDKEHVVLIKKDTADKRGQEWQHGLFNGIGGKIEEGESALNAMRREFREETGMEVKEWEPFCKIMAGCEVYFFRALGDVSRARTMEKEEVRRIPVNLLASHLIVPNLAWLVPMAATSERFTAEVQYLR